MKKCNYDEIFSTRGGAIISELEIQTIIHMLDEPCGKTVLDIGTGTGRIAEPITNLNNTVVGVDIEKQRLIHAVSRCNSYYYQGLIAAGQNLPFRNGTFDIVVANRVLKYFSNPGVGISEISRVTKKGGMCIIEISNMYSYEALFLLIRERLLARRYAAEMGPRYILFNPFWVIDSLRKENLEPIETASWHKIPPYFLHRAQNSVLLFFFTCAERVLAKIIPKFALARSIIVKCEKRLPEEGNQSCSMIPDSSLME